MRNTLFILFCTFSLLSNAQTSYEFYETETSVNEFDVLGDSAYETNLIIEQNIHPPIPISVASTAKADTFFQQSFIPQNCLDNNMKTAWMTPGNGKNDMIEFIIDIGDDDKTKNILLFEIAFFNGWRKDYQTWQNYSRIKKMSLSINDIPYAEINLADTYKHQYVDMEKYKIDKTHRFRFRFKILEIYPGKTHQQVALSDVQFIGKIK